jgi:catechol 2,3-dioxygenase-like lactoylglutathione lyase family enzyme
LWVADLARSVEFYAELFQTNESYLSEGFASVKGGGNEVLLHLLPEEYRDAPSLGEENPIKPVFTVSSVESFSTLLRGDIAQHDNWAYADLVDPDGHIIQIREKL